MDAHIVILGAGISGLSAAWRLASHGISVDVLESDKWVGGLAKTVRENNYSLDIGPHTLFSEQEWIIKTILGLFHYPLSVVPRKVKFFYNNKYLDYPLTAKSILQQMGLTSGIRVVFSYLKGKLLSAGNHTLSMEEETVEDWAISRFGEHLYQTFFKPYTEQFWKVSCRELSSRSIPTHTRMNLINTLRFLINRCSVKNSDSLINRETLTTYYPKTGFGEIPEKIAEIIRKLGGNIHLCSEVLGVSELPNGKMRVLYKNRRIKEIEGDYIISTIPLTSLAKILTPKPSAEVLDSANKLGYRSLVVLGMATKKQNILGCNYLYMLNRPYNRLSELNKFGGGTSPPGENIIMIEIPCLFADTIWKASKKELFDMCIDSLSEDGFLQPDDAEQLFLVKSSCAYPIYRKDYAVHLNRLLDYMKRRRALATLGRCGEFMYMDVDQCVKRAFCLADSILKVSQTSTNVKCVF